MPRTTRGLLLGLAYNIFALVFAAFMRFKMVKNTPKASVTPAEGNKITPSYSFIIVGMYEIEIPSIPLAISNLDT